MWVVSPDLLGFVVDLDACCAFVVRAIAVQERQWKTTARQYEGWVSDLLFIGTRHRQLFGPRADICWVDRAPITQLRGVMVVADVQMTVSVDTHTDAIVGVAQVVFSGQIEGFKRVARQVALHQSQCMAVNVEGRVLDVVVRQDAMVTKDDRVDCVASPGQSQINLIYCIDAKNRLIILTRT